MPAVEAHELGRQIDCAALAMGLDALARYPDIRVAVNMSARSIGYPQWMAILRRGLRDRPGLGERLVLEITESSAMLVPEIVIAFMDELQRDGIAFALDDFGAGFTAIRYFRDFFFDILKIDGQFVRGIDRDVDNQVVTAALLSIGRQFDMVCVAESVETAAEAETQKFLSLAAGEIAHGPAAARLVTVFGAKLDLARAQAIAATAFARLEAHLDGRDWLVGDRPTSADVAIYSYTAHAPEGGVSLDPYPRIRALLARIEALPGFVAMPRTVAGLATDAA
jgi:predicted signal transduction protein with EAL and GGDEF domain